jgi:serine/threonine-protein kinase
MGAGALMVLVLAGAMLWVNQARPSSAPSSTPLTKTPEPLSPEPTPAAPVSPIKAVVPRKPPSPGFGYLTLDAHPWATVFLNGKVLDRTPVSRHPVPAGTYQVLFKNPELKKTVERTVTVKARQNTRIRVNLEP